MRTKQDLLYQSLNKSVWAILFCLTALQAQKKDSLSFVLSQELSVDQRMDNAKTFLSHLEEKQYDSLHILYQNYAYWLFDHKQVGEAINCEKLALEFSKAMPQKDTAFIQKSALFLGYYYRSDKQYALGIDAIKEAVLINSSNELAIDAYNQLALSYRRISDYHGALEYYELIIAQLKKSGTKKDLLRNSYANAADACTKIGTERWLKKGIRYAKAADSMAKLIETSKGIRYTINLNLGKLYNTNETLNIPKSLKYYTEALKIAKELKNTTRIRNIHFQIGNLYNTTDYQKSTASFNKALEMTKATDSFKLYQIHMNLGAVNAYNDLFDEGFNYSHQGLAYLTGNTFEDPSQIDLDLLMQSEYKTNLLIAIPTLAEIYLKQYEESGDPSSLEKSIAYMEIADKLIDLLQLNSSHFKSRLFWRKLSTDIYGKAIRASFLSVNTEKTFYFMEKNKALLLQQDIATQNFKNSLEIPEALQKRERELKEALYGIGYLIETASTQSGSKIDSLKKLKIDMQLALTIVEDSIGIGTNKIQLEPTLVSLSDIQDRLTPDEVVIEYHISIDDGYGVYSNKDRGYVLVTTKNDTALYEIDELSKLEEHVTEVIDALRKPFATTEDFQNYTKLSNEVFLRLLPDEEMRKLIRNKKLIVIPDSYLSLLPFEALSVSDEEMRYLIQEAQIRYLYSNSFLSSAQGSSKPEARALAVAPANFKDQKLTRLRNSLTEVSALEDHFGGTILTEEKATKNSFLEQMETPAILHLATHADAQDSITPWIAFHDEKLLLEQLYLSKNNASLVFLSGCNTTLGKQEIGEGVISLARGFFYSGAESVISSLWSIDDRSTSRIVANFYENLSKGDTKAEALHNAKLSYITNHSGSEVSPYYLSLIHI